MARPRKGTSMKPYDPQPCPACLEPVQVQGIERSGWSRSLCDGAAGCGVWTLTQEARRKLNAIAVNDSEIRARLAAWLRNQRGDPIVTTDVLVEAVAPGPARSSGDAVPR